MRRLPTRSRASALAVVVAVALGGCGAGAGDPARQAEVLVETCRALQVRHLGRTVDGPTVEDARRFLALEPDAGARTVASWFRRVCPRSPADLDATDR